MSKVDPRAVSVKPPNMANIFIFLKHLLPRHITHAENAPMIPRPFLNRIDKGNSINLLFTALSYIPAIQHVRRTCCAKHFIIGKNAR